MRVKRDAAWYRTAGGSFGASRMGALYSRQVRTAPGIGAKSRCYHLRGKANPRKVRLIGWKESALW
jgi:hypothetical protein